MPVPEQDHHGVVAPGRRALPVLGEQRHVRVVVHVDGQPEPLAHQVAERDAL